MRNIIKMRTLLSSIVEKLCKQKSFSLYLSLEGKICYGKNLLEGTWIGIIMGSIRLVFIIYVIFALALNISVSSVYFAHPAILDVPSELEVYNLEGKKIPPQIESPSGFTMGYI